MDRTIGVLANDHNGADHVDTDIVWTMDNEMITSTIFGIVLYVRTPSDTAVDPASLIFKGMMTANKIHEMKQDKKLEASLHEESQQILKDIIREAGE